MKTMKKSFWCVLVPVLAGIIFIVLCCLNLTSSIWFDEAYSAYLIRGNFAEIWHLTAMDVHPPFFYFLLKIWSLIFGTTDFAMRFMSVFFGAISIVLAFQLIKRWFGFKPATVATFLLSVSPILIRYGQEMRMYTVVLAIVLAATLLLDAAITTKKRRYLIFYAVLVALGMWTHYFTALAWLTHVVWLISKKQFFKKEIILTYFLSVLLYLPWIPSFLKQVTTVQAGFWIGEITALTPIEFLSEGLMFMEADYVRSWLAITFIALIIFVIYWIIRVKKSLSKAQQPYYNLLLLLIFLPPFILLILSLPPLAPMFVSRYCFYGMVLIWALMGILLFYSFNIRSKISKSSKIKKLLPSLIFAVLIIVTSITGIINVTTREPRGYVKEIISPVMTLADDQEPIIAGNEYIYYDAAVYSSEEHPVYVIDEWIDYKYGSLEPIRTLKYNLVEDLPEFKNNHSKFWYVYDNTEKQPKFTDDNYRVINQITNEHHTAVELEKI